MPLTGTYPRTVDEKNRVPVPARLREQLDDPESNVLYLTPGTDHCVGVYTEAGLEQLAARLAEAPPTHSSVRTYLRLFYAQAERVEVDSQGRIRLPDRLISLAGVGREVVLLGVQDHIELWDRKRWEIFVEENSPRFDALAEGVFQPR